ncbi:hypothetical protein NCU02385 [Neurospora crassa OR74A]|uniref:THUMP domain-containing protein n=1 Tax=Neurospora crassa (strain ATCC 24698 / 74-OR23-1A / CBS 708.71 / DSM 1257 / FGSC 987) TaxID=367110 RepID=Q7S4P9_NEUCR|nr:hypothetical protein NCU02385 [Neurospora crassa OR74A]EAA30469.1 hypothetical protein NCU02385 [Neurospora crassa OR74A]|eukprot:XP_959705.1 hypothetical protein NCU02385 [Neurospora crassa OR74A]
MGGEQGKRKNAPGGDGGQKQKKKKTGGAGKWTTPNQANKLALERNSIPQIGDRGIWVTCARHQENKAAREVINLFEEYIETMYGIKPASKEAKVGDDDDADLDIEAAIAKELGAMKENKTADVQKQEEDRALLKAMKLNIDCLLFVRTKDPIEPVEFVKRIVVDTKECTDIRKIKCRYLNRLTPMSVMGKATEQGLAETARQVLEEHFDLSGKKGEKTEGDGGAEAETNKEGDNNKKREYKPYTYAIRPTIRNHSNLKRDVVINTIANLINDERHRVDLTKPDKVILVDIFQTVCGLSVVDGDWDELKKYNMTELYNQAAGITTVGQKKKQQQQQQDQKQDEKTSESVKDEETKDTKEQE